MRELRQTSLGAGVSEDKEGPESAPEGIGAGVDPVAIALALGGASRERADAFLRKQEALIDDQRHHLHEQFRHLHLSVWEKQLGVLLRLATAVVGIAFAAAVGVMVWDAAHSNGLLIEPFSVPPDLAARGLTGQVVATKLLDRLASMQAQTNSGRPAKSYANSWGEHGIKLEIPEAGISLNELDNFLRAKLGHDIHVSGEIVRKASGLALSARAGDASTSSITGQEEDMDALVQQLAEQVYRITQPFRYGMFLVTHQREAEALPVFEALSKGSDKDDRLWAYPRWAMTAAGLHGDDAAFPLTRQAIAAEPDAIGAYDSLVNYFGSKGRSEEGLQAARAQLAHLLDGKQTYISPARIPAWEKMLKARINNSLGAYHEAAETFAEFRAGFPGLPPSYFQTALIGSRISEHDLAGAREVLAEINDLGDVRASANLIASRMSLARAAEDWQGLLAIADAAILSSKAMPVLSPLVRIVPQAAYANARLGRFDVAETQIAATPADCYNCLRTRAQIAALKSDSARADYWFARAVGIGPSLLFAENEWGRALLARGKPDEAIEKFTLANQKGPRFADPLEGWGEALMAKNQSHLALAKFAQAEKYAPNWGRLHLKWGEALVYSGKRDNAQKQFARAAVLDLTPAEKSELHSMHQSAETRS